MAYDAQTSYSTKCDQCGRLLDDYDGIIHWESKESADIVAKGSDWKVWKDENGTMHHLCYDCRHKQGDDNDE